jgi:diguanylate cyclase (GGDEF)-like protein/PAS domain S-box-containing protein
MALRISLKEQIGRRLQTILGYYVVVSVLLVLTLALFSVAVFHGRQLEQYQALISTKLGTELVAQVREADSLAHSSVVWTGLTDSSGREAYLEPLLERINQNGARQIDLLDYRGRDYIISKHAEPGLKPSAAMLKRTIDSASLQSELQISPRGTRALFAVPVMAPFADGVLGIMLTYARLEEELQSLNLPSDLTVRYAWVNEGDAGPAQTSWLSRTVDLPLQLGHAQMTMRLTVSQSVWRWLPVVLSVLMLLLGCGYALFIALHTWAEKFSTSLTDRIERLVQVTSLAATQDEVHVETDDMGDEISTMFDAVQSIVMRQRSVNQQLRVSSRVFETAAEAILITDKQGHIADVNAALLRITGYQREELLGKPAGLLYRANDIRQQDGHIAQALREHGEWRGETFFVTRTQEQIPVMMAVSSLHNEADEHLGNVAIVSDIRDVKEVEARLRELIYHDQLTGLPNYLAFTEFIEEKLRQEGLTPQCRRFALLFIDLDYLKHINDTYGHEQGDQVIIQFAQYLQAHLPQPHFLCRRSGDEFIAVLDIDESSADLSQRLKAALPELVHRVRLAGDHCGMASFSVGAAAYPEHADNVKDLLVLADSALLYSKEAGRACVTWLNPQIIQSIQRRHLLEIKLKQALQRQDIVPHYQAEVDMRTGQVTGFEALARWSDPELGPISPAEFIPVAEEQGLIDAITEVLLNKLMADLPTLRVHFPGAKVAFNASPRLLANQRVFQLLRQHLDDAQTHHADLILEVTESDLMQSMEDASVQLEAIMGLGLQIAIDDFGTGYSSLSRLAYLPIHKLKIDRSFVVALGNEGNAKVVKAIMALAETLQLDVTAEGVETPFERDALLGMGCHRAQGYLFAKALPLSELLQMPNPCRSGVA